MKKVKEMELEIRKIREIENHIDNIPERRETVKKIINRIRDEINTELKLFMRRTYEGVIESKSDYYFFTLPETQKAIGYGALRNKSLKKEIPYLVELRHIIVSKEHRNKGYGKIIVKLLCEEAKKQGYEKIMSTSRTNNVSIKKVFERNDFIQEGVLENHYGMGRDLFQWGKLL